MNSTHGTMGLTGVILDSLSDDGDEPEVETAGMAEELSGRMDTAPDEERLAHSVLEHDDQAVQDGQMLAESVDYAISSFMPDLMFEKIVGNYRDAQRLYGPTLIRALTGFSAKYIEQNVKISEFQEKLKENIHRNVDRLKSEGLLDKEGTVTDEGLRLASLILYTEELDDLRTYGLGRKDTKEKTHYGEKSDRTRFNHHRYRDIDLHASIKQAILRGRRKISKEDLKAVQRVQHGRISIVYALDASGSMRGEKLHISKKAGIALAFRATQDKNEVGLVVFTSKIQESIPPTGDFGLLLDQLTRARAGQETDIERAIDHALHLFPAHAHTKHLVLITDALPTRGQEPGKSTLEAVGRARSAGITVSLVGINLEKEGEKLARRIAEIGEGKLYRVRNLKELDVIILEDYEHLKE